VLSGPAIERIQKSVLDKLIVTNSIPLKPEALACGRVVSLSVAPILAEGISRIAKGESVSSLFV
jgi:ribose-phosphate pyrophosphokinase